MFCLCTTCGSCAHGGQKKVLDLLGLELQIVVVVSCHVGAGNWSWRESSVLNHWAISSLQHSLLPYFLRHGLYVGSSWLSTWLHLEWTTTQKWRAHLWSRSWGWKTQAADPYLDMEILRHSGYEKLCMRDSYIVLGIFMTWLLSHLDMT